MMTMPTSERLQKLKQLAVLEAPFFGTVMLRLKWEEKPDMKALFGTDNHHLFYNKEVLKTVGDREALYVLVTTICHIVLKHTLRGSNKHEDTWEISADHATMDILKEISTRSISISVPRSVVTIDEFKGFGAEKIYERLFDPSNSENSSASGASGEDGEDGEDENEGQSSSSIAPEVSSKMFKPPSELSLEELHVNSLITEAAATAQGHMPQAFKSQMEELLNPKLPWYEILRPFLRFNIKADISWARPNRKFIAEDLYLPSHSSRKAGHIVLAIDTSGSVSNEEMKEFFSEVSSILAEIDYVSVTIVYCDAEIQHVKVFKRGEQIPVEVFTRYGCGGTDFRPVFSLVEEGKTPEDEVIEVPDILVYLTDTYGAFPYEEPTYPVIWVSNTEQTASIPWGEVLYL